MENVFQSTHPARDATRSRKRKKGRTKDFNPRIPRGMRRSKSNGFSKSFVISIHASREGCDNQFISICRMVQYFNPRIPRGMRHGVSFTHFFDNMISIHASREGCDNRSQTCRILDNYFNPRIPRGMRRSIKSMSVLSTLQDLINAGVKRL